MAEVIGGVAVEIVGDISKLQSDLQRGVEASRQGGQQMAAAFNEASANSTFFSDGHLNDLRSRLQSAIDRTKSLSTEMATAGGQAGSGFVTSFVGAFGGWGNIITATVTAPLLGIGEAAVSAASTMDDALDTIRARTGETGAAFAQLSTDFRQVFANAPEQAVPLAEALSLIHDRTELAGAPLQDLTLKLSNLSRVMGEDLKGVTESSLGALNKWNIEAGDMSTKLDAVMRAAQQTGTPVRELLEHVRQFAAPMQQFGMSFETALGFVGQFSKEGVNLSTVMSGLKTALKEFAQAGIEPEKALGDLFAQIKNTKSETEAYRLTIEAFGQKAAAEMFRVIRDGKTDFENLTATIRNGKETIDSATKDTDGFKEAWGRFRNEITLVLEPLGTSLLDAATKALEAMKPLLEVVGQVAEWFSKLPSPVQESILAFGLLAGPVTTAIEKFGGLLDLLPSVGREVTTVGEKTLETTGILSRLPSASTLGLGALAAGFAAVALNIGDVATKAGDFLDRQGIHLWEVLKGIATGASAVEIANRSAAASFEELNRKMAIQNARAYSEQLQDTKRNTDATDHSTRTHIRTQQDIAAALASSKQRWVEYEGALVTATRKLEDVDPLVRMLADDWRRSEVDHRTWIQAVADASRELGHLATVQETVNYLNDQMLPKVQALIDTFRDFNGDWIKNLNADLRDTAQKLKDLTDIPLTPTQRAIRDFGLEFVGVKEKVNDAFQALYTLINDRRASPEVLTQQFEQTGAAIQQLANRDLAAAIVKQQEYIALLIATHQPLVLLAEAYERQNAMIRQNLEDQIYVAQQQGKSADDAYIKLVNLDQKLKDMKDSTNLLGKAWETMVQAWNNAWDNMAEGIVDAIEGAKSWGDVWKGVLNEVKHELLTGFVKEAMGAARASIDGLIEKLGGKGGGISIGGISIPIPGVGSKEGPKGTSADPIHVIVQNMGSGGIPGIGNAGFPGMEGAGGIPGLGGAGPLASTKNLQLLGHLLTTNPAVGIAGAFAAPAYAGGQSLFGDPGPWKDPEKFAESMFRMTGGKFQIDNPVAQSNSHNLFGGNLRGGVPGPEDTAYWQQAIQKFKELTDAILGGGLGVPKGTSSVVTEEQRNAAIETLTLSIAALKENQTSLTDGIIAALAKGDMVTAVTLENKLDVVNQNISDQSSLLERIQGNTGDTADAVNGMSGIVASTEQQTEALKQAQEAVNALKAQEADLQQQIIVAIASGDMELAMRLAGELSKVDGQLQTANGFLDLIKESTGQMALTAEQQALLIDAAAQAFGPAALTPLIDTIDRLRGEQRDLQGQLAEAVRNGDTVLAEQLARRLDTVNGQLETARGQFSTMNAAISAQAGNSEAVVAATQAMETALKSGDIAAITKASGELRAAMDAQPDRIAQAQSDLMAAIMSGNTAEIITALGNLETAMAESAREETARQTAEKLEELKQISHATREEQLTALNNAKTAVDDLRTQQSALMEDLIMAVASGDQDLIAAVEAELGIVQGSLRNAEGFYERLEALIPSEVDRIVGRLGDIAENLYSVTQAFAESQNLPSNWGNWNDFKERFAIPTDPGKIREAMEGSQGEIEHWEDLIRITNESIREALAAGAKESDPEIKGMRADLKTYQDKLDDLKFLKGIYALALKSSGTLTQAELDAAIAGARERWNSLNDQWNALNRMLINTSDPAMQSFLRGQMREIASDLKEQSDILKQLEATNLDGSQKTEEEIKAAAKKTETALKETAEIIVQGHKYTVKELRDDIKKQSDGLVGLRTREAELMTQLQAAWASGNDAEAQRLGRELQTVRDAIWSSNNFIQQGTKAIEDATKAAGTKTSESTTSAGNKTAEATTASGNKVAEAVTSSGKATSTAIATAVTAAYQATAEVIRDGYTSLQAFARSFAGGNMSMSPMAQERGVANGAWASTPESYLGGRPEYYQQAAAQAQTLGHSVPMNMVRGGPNGTTILMVNPDGTIIPVFDLDSPFEMPTLPSEYNLADYASRGMRPSSEAFVAPTRDFFDSWLRENGLAEFAAQYVAEVQTRINEAETSFRQAGATATSRSVAAATSTASNTSPSATTEPRTISEPLSEGPGREGIKTGESEPRTISEPLSEGPGREGVKTTEGVNAVNQLKANSTAQLSVNQEQLNKAKELSLLQERLHAVTEHLVAVQSSANTSLISAAQIELDATLANVRQAELAAATSFKGFADLKILQDRLLAAQADLKSATESGNAAAIDDAARQVALLQEQVDIAKAKAYAEVENMLSVANAQAEVKEAIETKITESNEILNNVQEHVRETSTQTAAVQTSSAETAVNTGEIQASSAATQAAAQATQTSTAETATNTQATSTAAQQTATNTGEVKSTLDNVVASLSSLKTALDTGVGNIVGSVASIVQPLLGGLAGIASAIAAIQPSVTNNYYSYSTTTNVGATNSAAAAAAGGTSTQAGAGQSTVGGGSGAGGGHGFAEGGIVPYDMHAMVHEGEWIFPANITRQIMQLPRVPNMGLPNGPSPSGSAGGTSMVNNITINESRDPQKTLRELQRFYSRLTPKALPQSA